MAGRVFISCGQVNSDEVRVANDVSLWLRSVGFDPYVAVETQSILDVNSGIIGELKRSDFYLFINFRRDLITSTPSIVYRGSVFTNQELGIAYAMGFEKALFINQRNVKREGIFGYLVSNTPEFETLEEVLPIVKQAIRTANWTVTYSRNLICENLRWGEIVGYGDHTGERQVKVLHIDIVNSRPDQGALNTVARLRSITSNGVSSTSADRSHLKCSGALGYSNTIWPKDHIAFDLLSIDIQNQLNIYLHSALDVRPRTPLISALGNFVLEYEVFAESFPPIRFKVSLSVTGQHRSTTATLLQ
jgi:hypothetical protein